MIKIEPADARREAGDRTRARLLDAAKSLIAQYGESGVSLRDITEAAEANIGSVSYHYGSKEKLCRAAIEDAIATVTFENMRAMCALPTGAGVDQISSALVATIVRRMTSRYERERALLSISAREILAGDEQTSYATTSADLFEHIHMRLRLAMPHVHPSELRFRADAAATLLHIVAAGALSARTAGVKRTRLTRWLVSAVRGCLEGTGSNVAVGQSPRD